MARIESWFRQDLKEPVHVQMIKGNVFSQDEQANLIGVTVTDGGEAATLSGSVAASIIRADGATIAQAGTLSGNMCSVVLPASAYAVPGPLVVTLKLTYNGAVTTLLAVAAMVYRSSTDTVVDPGTIIPSIQDLIAEIDEAVASIPQDYSKLSATVSSINGMLDDYGTEFYIGAADDETVLFTSDDVAYRDVIYYDFYANYGFAGYIGLYDSNDTRIVNYGKGSSSSGELHYEGYFQIPQNFSYAKVVANRGGTTKSYILIKWLSRKYKGYYDDADRIMKNSFDASLDVSENITLSKEFFSNQRFIYYNVNEGYRIVESEYYLSTPFIKVYKGDVVRTRANGLYTQVYYLRRFDHVSSRQAEFVTTDYSYTVPDDGFVVVSIKKDAVATQTITPADIETAGTEIIFERTRGKMLTSYTTQQKYFNRVQIKHATSTFEGYSYLAFSGGAMYNGKEIHVCRAADTHRTSGDSTEWGKLIFFILQQDSTIADTVFDRPSEFNFEMRDPNLSVTRNNHLILSGFGTRYENEVGVHGSYMMILSNDGNTFTIEDALYNYVPSAEITFGNTIQDENGYLYIATYGKNSNKTVCIYKSTTPLESEAVLPAAFELFAEYTDQSVTSVEPTIAFCGNNRIVVMIRRESTDPYVVEYDLTGTIQSEGSIAGCGILHSPALLPYYNNNHILFAGSFRHGTDTSRRSPLIGYFDLSTKKTIAKQLIESLARQGGYPSLVPIGQGLYSSLYYLNAPDGTATYLFYKRMCIQTYLNTYYVNGV